MCTTCGCSDRNGVTISTPEKPTKYGVSPTRQSLGRQHATGGGQAGLLARSALTYLPVATGANDHQPGAASADWDLHTSGPTPADSATDFVGDSSWHDPGLSASTHAEVHGTILSVEKEVLAKNQALAHTNRRWFESRGILALNLVSSPGSGKTTLLERTIRDLRGELTLEVVEGDQATQNDSERIRATGCKVIQINTGTGCHLDAEMLRRGLNTLVPAPGAVLMIENVGNLVCPALFDLGEDCKVVILSVTEGEDKPLKYPHMFRASRVMLLNKIDLLPHLRFDVARCVGYARLVNPEIRIFQVSAESGEGMADWYGWLHAQRSLDRRTEETG